MDHQTVAAAAAVHGAGLLDDPETVDDLLPAPAVFDPFRSLDKPRRQEGQRPDLNKLVLNPCQFRVLT